MKSIIIILLVFSVVSITSCSGQNIHHSIDAKEIREHIDKIFLAYINKDTATVRSTHSENWRGFLTYSKQLIRGIEGYMKEVRGSDGLNKTKSWKLISYKMLDYDVVFNDKTGVVSYIAELYWQDGKAMGSYKLRSVDIYGKENDKWTQIASNICALP